MRANKSPTGGGVYVAALVVQEVQQGAHMHIYMYGLGAERT
jgi:hypothetical protein